MAIVNEAFVKRFFKPEEDPLDQHFGLNLPENVNHFRIVGVIADARFQSFQTRSPGAADVLRAAARRRVKYENPMMKRVRDRVACTSAGCCW